MVRLAIQIHHNFTSFTMQKHHVFTPEFSKTLEKHHSTMRKKKCASGQFLETADEQFALVDHLGGQVVVEGKEEFFVAHDLLLPLDAIDGL
jgi:hypothetical protein